MPLMLIGVFGGFGTGTGHGFQKTMVSLHRTALCIILEGLFVGSVSAYV